MSEQPWFQHYSEWVPRSINPSRMMPVSALMDEACRLYRDKPALVCFGHTLTYGEVEQAADRLARYFQHELGLKAGDRLAIMLPNVHQFPVVFYAASRAGLICVPTNPMYSPREMRHQFVNADCAALVICDVFLRKLQEILPQTPLKHVIATGLADMCPAWRRIPIHAVLRLKRMIPRSFLRPIAFRQALSRGAHLPALVETCRDLDDIALLQYTGGTTGISKGAMLTHRNVTSNVAQVVAFAGPRLRPGKETVLTALPLYHVFAMTVNFLTMFSLGERLVLLPKPTPIINTIRAFRRFPVTVTTGVNTLFSALVNHPEFQRQPPRGLRVVIAGGMALHADVARRFTELTGFSIAEGFGMTEASPVTHCNPLHQANGQGTIGVPLPSTVARVVDEHLRDVPHGSPGELVVRGPQVMKGYWQSPEATAGVLRDGWLLTGDMARMSAAGIFEICERKKEMILVSGFNVFPREVEEVLMAHPKVLEAAVLGLPDPRTGESVKAFVVPRDVTLSVAELRDYCSKELAGYKRPRFYEFRDSLPKSVIGKILKRELRAEQEARVSAHPIE